MKNYKLFLFSMLILLSNPSFGQNPIIRDQFSADPTARVFNGKVYLYPSHDILGKEGQGRPGWFCMEDYHVFSSENLTDWTDHGMIVSQTKVDWADPKGYSMWAPDCIERNGKYYFYFPAGNKEPMKGMGIGVAIADKPEGPYVPLPEPIKGATGIDPNVFIDKDGQAYMYWAGNGLVVAKLKENMTELASEPIVIANLPTEGLKEGPFLFERNGKYYFTFPHVQNKTERLEYAMGDSPMGPFKMTGVIMDESPTECWTNHHSFIQYKDQWYLFYHHNDYSPKFDKNRSVRIDSMFFNNDGTIQKVIPTLRGVGVSCSKKPVEIDRYSDISKVGASIALLDTLNTFKGWKTKLDSKNAWIRYNTVHFCEKIKSVQVKVLSTAGGVLEIRLDNENGPVAAEVNVPKGVDWSVVTAKISKIKPGVHDLLVILKEGTPVEVDWVQFK